MTKYMVFKNQPDSGQVNAPGSREEMASEIANVVSQDRMLPNYYIAFPAGDANVSMQSLREMARFTVEITDETAALWTQEIQPMVQKAHNVDDAVSEASGGIYQAMIEYNSAIQNSNKFVELTELSIKELDRTFEFFEVESSYEVPTMVGKMFSVESFDHHLA